MPNRIIKESLCDSEKIASLSDFEFRLWVGLITQADDAGRGDARPAIIKGRVFPFRERLSIKDIDAALQELAAKGCVSLYTVDGRPYFLCPGWVKHQRIRDCKPKFPEPPENTVLPQSAASRGNLRQVAAICGESRQSAALIQSESESKSNPNCASAFDVFWQAYPRKTGKAAARKAFDKAKPPLDVVLNAIEAQKHSAQWQRDNGQYIPYPATWLNQGRWEDEVQETELPAKPEPRWKYNSDTGGWTQED